MYKKSKQAARASGSITNPLGGINFVFAGNFAQLPPARSGPLILLEALGLRCILADHAKSKSAIGKALWHKLPWVVILRQNMRQAKQTVEDAKLRTALRT